MPRTTGRQQQRNRQTNDLVAGGSCQPCARACLEGLTMTTLTTTIGQIVRGDRVVFPPYLYAAYQSTKLRAPTQALIEVPLTLSELTGPGPVMSSVTPEDADMTRNAGTGSE